jgi:hypothetical protein
MVGNLRQGLAQIIFSALTPGGPTPRLLNSTTHRCGTAQAIVAGVRVGRVDHVCLEGCAMARRTPLVPLFTLAAPRFSPCKPIGRLGAVLLRTPQVRRSRGLPFLPTATNRAAASMLRGR